MQIRMKWIVLGAALAFGTVAPSMSEAVQAQDAVKADGSIELAGGKMRLKAPAEWKVVKPKNNIISHEFTAPADAAADKQARVTVSTASGAVDQNLDRWYGQFEQPDGASTKEKSKLEKFDVAGQTVHMVDIPGTFKDSMGAGPFQQAPAVKREKYRMLGAIVETKDMGLHFFKITGPSDSLDKLKDGFKKMLEGLEVKK